VAARRDRPAAGGPVSDAFRVELGSDPADAEAMRMAVCEMASRGRFGERVGDLALALAEIVANAREHGRPPVVVRAWLEGRLVVEVSDTGTGFDHEALMPDSPPSHGGHRGRGLWIARQLVDVFRVRTGPTGTTVRMELSPEPHIGA
jgi:anti-sigma regulatory factor (Ser/Thr protein kinase)